jgi:hypothetical protein
MMNGIQTPHPISCDEDHRLRVRCRGGKGCKNYFVTRTAVVTPNLEL